MKDPLVARDCVILDGTCDCKWPAQDCKYVEKAQVLKELEGELSAALDPSDRTFLTEKSVRYLIDLVNKETKGERL